MPDLQTLLNIRTQVRDRADMIGSLFVTDAQVDAYIVSSYKELYDMLVDAVEEYNLSASTIAIASGNGLTLPSNFYKLRGVDDLTNPGYPLTVRKFNFGERNDFLDVQRMGLAAEFSDVMYRISGNSLIMFPAANAIKTYQIWFYPTPTIPVANGDTIETINGFDEYIIVDAAIKCLLKEESDIKELMKIKTALIERITIMKANRDVGTPEKITRVRNRRRSGIYPYAGVFSD